MEEGLQNCYVSLENCDFFGTEHLLDLRLEYKVECVCCGPVEKTRLHTFFFISINIFQPSLKLMLNLSRFQPQNMLM